MAKSLQELLQSSGISKEMSNYAHVFSYDPSYKKLVENAYNDIYNKISSSKISDQEKEKALQESLGDVANSIKYAGGSSVSQFGNIFNNNANSAVKRAGELANKQPSVMMSNGQFVEKGSAQYNDYIKQGLTEQTATAEQSKGTTQTATSTEGNANYYGGNTPTSQPGTQTNPGTVNAATAGYSPTDNPTGTQGGGIDMNNVTLGDKGQPQIWRSQDRKDIYTQDKQGNWVWISPTEFQSKFSGKAQEVAGYVPQQVVDQNRQQQTQATSPTTQQNPAPASPATPTTPATPTATTPTTTNTQQDYTDIDKGIDADASLTESQKTMLKAFARQHTGGFDQAAILNTFDKIKSTTIDPYFDQEINKVKTDIGSQFKTLNANRERELENQRYTQGENIRQVKSDLEARGMTNSGSAIKELGAQSAYNQEGQSGNIPGQTAIGANETIGVNQGLTTTTPFGDDRRFYEGTVNQQNRLMSSASATAYQQAQQQLGQAAENALGTAGAGSLGIAYNPAGVQTGSIEYQRQQTAGNALSDVINNQSTANENINKTLQNYKFTY